MNDEAYRAALRAFVTDRIGPHIDAWEQAGSYPIGLHAEAGAARLLALGEVPGPDLPLQPARLRVLIEELTRGGSQGLAIGLSSHFVSLAIVAAAAPALSASVIADVLSGGRTIALALTEQGAGSDLAALDTRAVPAADGSWRITGEKRFICNGTRADCLLVGARTSAGLGLFLVERPQAAITVDPLDPLGWRCLPLAAIHFSDARARLIAEAEQAGRALRGALTQERLNLAVMAVTSAEVVRDAAVCRSRRRLIRGAPLIAMTHVRQTLAEVHTAVSVARDFVDRTVVKDGEARVAMAKNAAVAALEHAARIAVQLHGASGCIAPSLVERTFRDAPLVAIGGGTTEVMNEIIARSLDKEA